MGTRLETHKNYLPGFHVPCESLPFQTLLGIPHETWGGDKFNAGTHFAILPPNP